MAREKPPELTLEEIFQQMERSALQDHPNPTRRGCPDGETLEAFAQNPKAFAMRDPLFEHLAQCSPCFQFVQERRRR
ncbi:MAG: hypothetical protein J0H49_29010 [Acidobacteria bacterium]|nr:hypothetical protein [Acidobacteriota bacterium]